jgi:hypothetical protein
VPALERCARKMMKMRKQVYDLTLDDITRYPVWEYAVDEEGDGGQDEATVRPITLSDVELQNSSCMVRTQFNLADRTILLGLVTISGLPDDGIIRIEGDADSNAKRQPVIITERGQSGFWFGAMKPEDAEIAHAYRVLGARAAAEVFPISYVSDLKIPTGAVTGRIGGFQYLESKLSCLDCVMKEIR